MPKKKKQDANDDLYGAASEAITELFSDTSVSKERTAELLRELKSEIDLKIESLGL